MKEKSNNEIDLLLRRMSRQDGSVMSDGEAQHLDVDELSSYAQNALPAAARARYTEHLADCSTCRKLVTELSLSLGTTAAAAAPVETISAAGGLKQFLASLFSPMVLRYAVPALGLIVVAAIGFVTLRQRQNSVAQRIADQDERAPITATPSAPAQSQSPAAGLIEPQNESANANPVKPANEAPKSGTVASEPAGAGTAPVAVAPPVRDEQRAAEPQAAAEAEPPPPRAAKAAAVADTEDQKKREATEKKQEAVNVETKQAEISTSRATEPAANYQRAPQTASQREENKAREDDKPKDTPVVRRGASVGGVARVFSTGEADKNDADTRTIAGRRFRKERGIWTDTAYDSSTATVNIARGSDQFKALVADEPEIKKIAEQLDGEVIVVWKGRAYRIR
jgi:hypothetical protein